MKNRILITYLAAVLIVMTACKDENLAPIATFDAAEKGAYPALIEDTDRDINLDNVAGSAYVYSIEFIDLEKGNLVSEYALQVTYQDANTADGDNSTGPVEFRSWSASDFETNGNGNKGLPNITINASDVLTALGLTEVGPGDVFRFIGRVTTTSGQSFMASNSSASVNGAAFRGHFNYSLTAICPSDIGGTYSVTSSGQSTDGCCPDPTTVTTTITLMDNGKGNYTMNDFSGGLYLEWYDVYGITATNSSGVLIDVCDKLTFGHKEDPFGGTLTASGTVEADGNFTIEWSNSFGDVGTSVYTKQ